MDLSLLVHLMETPKEIATTVPIATHINSEDRIKALTLYMKKYEYDYGVMDNVMTDLLKLWENYISSKVENLIMYDILKNKIVDVFGMEIFEDFLNYTRFLHQTAYLDRRGVEDIDSEEFLVG